MTALGNGGTLRPLHLLTRQKFPGQRQKIPMGTEKPLSLLGILSVGAHLFDERDDACYARFRPDHVAPDLFEPIGRHVLRNRITMHCMK